MPGRLTPEVISMLEHIPNAFYALDRNFTFLHANSKIQQLLNKTEDELIGQNIWTLFPAWKERNLYALLHQTMSKGQPARLEEFSPAFQKWFEINAYPSSYGLAIYVTDITDRKNAEAKLVMLNRAGQILAGEHDLQSALEQIAHIVVPAFTDWFVVYQLKEDTADILHLHHHDPEKDQWAVKYKEQMRLDMSKPRAGSVPWVIRLGQAVLYNDGDDTKMGTIAPHNEHPKMFGEIDVKARIVVPMPMRGKTIGAVSFTSTLPNRIYDDVDLRFATDLGVLIGMSIENTRMFEEMKKELAQKIREHGLQL
jgi:PAS domain S-box-containing protein